MGLDGYTVYPRWEYTIDPYHCEAMERTPREETNKVREEHLELKIL